MKMIYKLTDKMSIDVEGSTQKEIFLKLAELQKMYEPIFGIEKCGCCGSPDFNYIVREAETAKKKMCNYYELHCTNNKCKARFSYGQSTDNETLFPKDKDDNKMVKNEFGKEVRAFLPNGGWSTEWKNFAKES